MLNRLKSHASHVRGLVSGDQSAYREEALNAKREQDGQLLARTVEINAQDEF